MAHVVEQRSCYPTVDEQIPLRFINIYTGDMDYDGERPSTVDTGSVLLKLLIALYGRCNIGSSPFLKVVC